MRAAVAKWTDTVSIRGESVEFRIAIELKRKRCCSNHWT